MTVIKLHADGQKLYVLSHPCVASGSEKCVTVQVTFSPEWDECTKSAVFFTSLDDTAYEVLLIDNACVVPHEVLAVATDLFIGVRGINDGKIPTSLVKYEISEGTPTGNATPVEPTPDVYQQILMHFDRAITNYLNDEQINTALCDYLDRNPILSKPAAGVVQLTINGIGPDENGNFIVNTLDDVEIAQLNAMLN